MDPNEMVRELHAFMRAPCDDAAAPPVNVLDQIALTPRGWARYQRAIGQTLRRVGVPALELHLAAEVLANGDLAVHCESSTVLESLRFPRNEWHWRRPVS